MEAPLSDDAWLTPQQVATRLECSDQTVIARIKAGEFDPDDVQIRPEGSRPRYLLRARALESDVSAGPRQEGPEPATATPRGAEPSEVGQLRAELARVRRDLTDVTAERDRLRAEVVKLKDVGLHLMRATEAFLLPDTLND